MNKIPYREYHLFQLLESYQQQTLPLDLFISHYFRDHAALGSKDRGFIAETIYALVRWQGLLDYLSPSSSWSDRYQTYLKIDFNQLQQQEEIPLAARVSFPQPLFDLFVKNYGVEKALELCLVCNTPAPTTIRVNPLKISRDDLLKRWQDIYDISPTLFSPNGIIFHKKINFFQLPEFKEGFFEVQDEGSQLLANLIKVQPGELVLDYCAGSGGKTLAFAPLMEEKGQIYVHDIRPFALQEARKRLRRAGIQNYQILAPDSPNLENLKKKMNWVLVDVPCSGTGTLRRNPDMKWKFDSAMLTRLIGQQRMIFEKALSFLHPEGRIVYGTCSLLKEENQEQIKHFLSTYSLEIEGEFFQTVPTIGGMDGFFGVVLKRKNSEKEIEKEIAKESEETLKTDNIRESAKGIRSEKEPGKRIRKESQKEPSQESRGESERAPSKRSQNESRKAPSKGFGSESGRAPNKEFRSESERTPGKRFGSKSGRTPSKGFRSESERAPSKRFGSESGRAPSKEFGIESERTPSKGFRSESERTPGKRFGSESGRAPSKEFGSESERTPGKRSRSKSGRTPSKGFRSESERAPSKGFRSESGRAPGKRIGKGIGKKKKS